MRRLHSRVSVFALFTTLYILSNPTFALDTKVENLKPEEIQSKTSIAVVNQLSKHHYRQQELNDSLSSQFLDEYLKALDSSKNFFLASDISEFEKYRKTFDDEFKAGKLNSAFTIYNRFNLRFTNRLANIIDSLEKKDVEYNFDVEESIVLDRKNEPWPASKVEADKLWQKHIKYNLLNSMLGGKSLEESKSTLRKRYVNQLRYWKKQTPDDVFSVTMNTLTLLFDPHTNYFSPDASKDFDTSMSNKFEGIGAELRADDDYIKVSRLITGSPAAKQGQLKPNDRIVGIAQGEKGEFEDVIGWRLRDVVKKIRGEKGTVVKLDVVPSDPTATEHKTILIKRDTIELEDQAAKQAMFNIKNGEQNYKLGVIDLPTFYMDFNAINRNDPNYTSATRDVRKLLDVFIKEKVDGVIIDLRENGGGSLPEAAMLTELFINPGPVVQIRQNDDTVSRDFRSNRMATYTGPLIVLTNRLSASASEIFAGAIQDYGRGLIVGSTTFGKGSVQTMLPIAKGEGELKITQAKFYRVSGDSTQHRGVVPDLELPTLINTKDIGESSYENALPWDQIHAAPHDTYYNISSFIPQLNPPHQERMKTDPDFIFLRQQAALYEELSNKKTVSLRLATRKQEQDLVEQRTLNMENQKRKAKGEVVYATYADYKAKELKQEDEDAVIETTSKELEPAKDPYMMESGRIMADFIQQLKKQSPSKLAKQ
jgi:carboxyl-terminal processing protease